MFVLQMRKRTQVEQRATLCVGEAGAEVSLLGSSPLPQGPCLPHAQVLPFSPLPGAGRFPGTAAGSLAPWGSPQPRCPGDTAGDGGRVMGPGPASPFPGCPSQATCPTDPLTTLLTLPHEYSPGVLEPRKVAQPGGPAPSGLFAWCPPGSETLDK